MGWAPATFWRATPREFRLAFEGYAAARGVKVPTLADRIASPGRLARLRALNDNPEPEVRREQ